MYRIQMMLVAFSVAILSPVYGQEASEEDTPPDYDSKLEEGMSYSDVVEALGGDGHKTASIGKPPKVLSNYEWTWYEGRWGIFVLGKFENDKLNDWGVETWDVVEALRIQEEQLKAQIESSRPAKIGKDDVILPEMTTAIISEIRFAVIGSELLSSISTRYNKYVPDSKYLRIVLYIKNEDDVPHEIDRMMVIDENGARYTWTISPLDNNYLDLGPDVLNPGNDKLGYILFDVSDDHRYWLELPKPKIDTRRIYVELNPIAK